VTSESLILLGFCLKMNVIGTMFGLAIFHGDLFVLIKKI
jgi:hypothetical protein